MGKSICIYIHIPFCVKKCRYCDFPSFAGKEEVFSAYFDALFSEISGEELTEGRTADTIYIGGGTPSCVPPFYILRILEEAGKKYVISADAEISMEVNPLTVGDASLKEYRAAGINRISMGCQSFNDESLKRLGRIHRAEDIYPAYESLLAAGFDNINLDLISSLPGEKREDMEKSLKEALSLSPAHISVYSLIIEPGTGFYSDMERGLMEDLPDEDEVFKTDIMIREMLSSSGYSRYEISNYAKDEKECRHNSAYWNRLDYRGFGLGAASLVGHRRFTNIRNLSYITSPGKLFEENRILSRREEMEEFMFLGLRQIKGVGEEDFKKNFSTGVAGVFPDVLEKQIKEGFMLHENGRYRYTERGLDISNILLSEFVDTF